MTPKKRFGELEWQFFHVVACLDGQLHSCIAIRKDNMVYFFSGQNSSSALPTIEEESEEPEPESLENIEFSMECRDAVTMSDVDGSDGSSQEDDVTTEHQFRLHLSPREQETARNSIFYSWMKPEVAYSRQILNT